MKNRYFRICIKVLLYIVCFIVIFALLQEILIPRFYDDSTGIVDGFYELEKDELDVLCLGSSQMFCSIDAQLLTKEYGINTYDFGASDQPVFATKYYFEEAMKTQSPKLILIEVTKFFNYNLPLDDSAIAWTYTPTKISSEKFQSLLYALEGDTKNAIEYCYFPGLAYHNRWKSLGSENFIMLYTIQGNSTINTHRGFVAHEEITPVVICNNKENATTDPLTIPEENIESISYILDACAENDIKVLFFKSPNANWGLDRSLPLKTFMEDNGLDFIDLNDYISDIGLDKNQDFYDSAHLNKYGAKKTTEYLVPILNDFLA